MFRAICLLSCVILTLGQDYDLDVEDVDPPSGRLSEKIRRINSVIVTYDRELDRIVPFGEIREAIQGLDIMARNYTGAYIADISRASTLGYRATDNYFRATDEIVRWCGSASRVFKFILKNHADLPQAKIQRSVKKSLNNGLAAFKVSMQTLQTVARQLGEMERTLRPLPENLNKELMELQLEHKHAVERLRRNKLIINTALTAVAMLTAFIISFYLGGIAGGIIGVGIKMALSQIPTAVIEGRMIPSMEEKMKITEAYYLTLVKTIEHAAGNVSAVRDELDKRLQFGDMSLNTGGGEIEVDRRPQSEVSQIITELREFIITLDEMKERHMPHTRHRRTISNPLRAVESRETPIERTERNTVDFQLELSQLFTKAQADWMNHFHHSLII